MRRFLEGDAEESDLPTDTLKRIKECYRQFRNVFMSVQGELEARVLQAQRSVAAVELERKRTEHPGGQAAAAVSGVAHLGRANSVGAVGAQGHPSLSSSTHSPLCPHAMPFLWP